MRPLTALLFAAAFLPATPSFASASVAGNALYFDGSDDEAVIPHSSNISFGPSSKFTVELWVRRTGSSSVYHIIGKRALCGPDPDDFYQLARDPGGWGFGTRNCAVGDGATSDPPLNTWIHVAVTYDQGDFRLYLNGEQVNATNCPLVGENGVPLKFGGSSTCAHFNGYLDEIRFWSVVRTADQIRTHYRYTADPNTPGLVGYWNFDEALSDQNVFDVAGPHDGTLGASVAVASDDPQRVGSTAPLLSPVSGASPGLIALASLLLLIVGSAGLQLRARRTSSPNAGLV